jgi:multidrug transporter EmrE-like cation transporter
MKEGSDMPWLLLGIAITGEVIATTALKASDGFAKWGYGGISIVGYGISFYFLAIVLKTIPVGVAYAIWAGAGVAMVTIIGVVLFGQKLDLFAYLGICLIVAGVIVLNLLSGTTTH